MEIKTKYQNNDKVWTVNKDTLKAEEVTVEYVYISTSYGLSISYRIGSEFVEEGKLFATKEELLNYISE